MVSIFKTKPDPWDGIGISSRITPDEPTATGSGYPSYPGGMGSGSWDGEKFFGGIGIDYDDTLDYWTLRQRSAELFRRNIYGRGIIRRFVTNVIATGLGLEALPDENVLGITPEQAVQFSEMVEAQFRAHSMNKYACDFLGRDTLPEIQTNIYTEALIEGDVLVIRRGTSIQVIRGGLVRNPDTTRNNEIVNNGVVLDSDGRHVAFYILKTDGTYARVDAKDANGDDVAWLVYGTDQRYSDVRGEPFLAIAIQSFKELDRYRDSAQRKATINSNIATFIERTDATVIKSKALTTGAASRNVSTVANDTTSGPRSYAMAEAAPGIQIQNLAAGETVKAFQGMTDVDFGAFEAAILNTLSWAYEVSPEVMQMSFNSNYAASAGAKDETRLFIDKRRFKFGLQVNTNIYKAVVVDLHARRVMKTPGVLKAYREGGSEWTAWTLANWQGAVKSSSDMKKTTAAYAAQCDEGFCTRTRAARDINGSKFSDNVKQLKRENMQLADAMTPIAEFKQKFGMTPQEFQASIDTNAEES